MDLVVAAGFIAPSQHWGRLEPRSAAGGAAGDAVISWVLYALFRRRWQGCPGCCWQGGCPGVASLCPPLPAPVPPCHVPWGLPEIYQPGLSQMRLFRASLAPLAAKGTWGGFHTLHFPLSVHSISQSISGRA